MDDFERKIIPEIDPALEFRSSFRGTTSVYEVRKDDSVYVLKMADLLYNNGSQQIQTERRALSIAKDFEGITHLVHDYGDVGQFTAILKEYEEGEDLRTLSLLENIIPKDAVEGLKKQVEEIVRNFHQSGVAILDLGEYNFVVSPDFRKITLVDLGACRFADTLPLQEFERLKSLDISDISSMIY